MKESRFNVFHTNSENITLAYNSYSGALAKIDNDFIRTLNGLKDGDNIDALPEYQKELALKMKDAGYIVDKDKDELSGFRSSSYKQRSSLKRLRIVITPTLECNFECVYCYETPITGKMSGKTQSDICNFISLLTCKYDISHLSVVWYGGEPLLCEDIIQNLSQSLIELCKSSNITYSALIITNGYLINNKILSILIDCKITYAQITLDGQKDIHNRRRYLSANPDADTFGIILNNINLLLSHSIQVGIRINIDSNNKDNVRPFIKYLGNEIDHKDKVKIYLGHVFSDDDSPYKGFCISKQQFANCKMNSLLEISGFNPDASMNRIFPKIRLNYCSALLDNSFVVGVNGDVYKCWNDVCNSSYSVGCLENIIESGDIVGNSELSKWKSYHVLNIPKCRKCNLLPICSGGCPRKQVHDGKEPECQEIKYMIRDMIDFYSSVE